MYYTQNWNFTYFLWLMSNWVFDFRSEITFLNFSIVLLDLSAVENVKCHSFSKYVVMLLTFYFCLDIFTMIVLEGRVIFQNFLKIMLPNQFLLLWRICFKSMQIMNWVIPDWYIILLFIFRKLFITMAQERTWEE